MQCFKLYRERSDSSFYDNTILSDFSWYFFSGNCCTLQTNINFYEHLERNMHLKAYLGKEKDYTEKAALAHTKQK